MWAYWMNLANATFQSHNSLLTQCYRTLRHYTMTLYCLYYKNATLTQQTFHLPLIHLYVTMLILMTVPFWCGWHCVGLLLKTFGSKWQRGRSLHSVAISSSCPGVTKQTGLASWHWSSSVLTLMFGIKPTAAERIIMTLLGGQWISKCWSLAARHSCSNSSALVATQTDWVQVTLFACKALFVIDQESTGCYTRWPRKWDFLTVHMSKKPTLICLICVILCHVWRYQLVSGSLPS